MFTSLLNATTVSILIKFCIFFFYYYCIDALLLITLFYVKFSLISFAWINFAKFSVTIIEFILILWWILRWKKKFHTAFFTLRPFFFFFWFQNGCFNRNDIESGRTHTHNIKMFNLKYSYWIVNYYWHEVSLIRSVSHVRWRMLTIPNQLLLTDTILWFLIDWLMFFYY